MLYPSYIAQGLRTLEWVLGVECCCLEQCPTTLKTGQLQL